MKRPDALELIAWTLMGCLFWIIIVLVVAIIFVVITITTKMPDLPLNLPCAGLSGAEWYSYIL